MRMLLSEERPCKLIKISLEGDSSKRKFILPQLNRNATNLFELLDSAMEWTPPPLISEILFESLAQLLEEGSISACPAVHNQLNDTSELFLRLFSKFVDKYNEMVSLGTN